MQQPTRTWIVTVAAVGIIGCAASNRDKGIVIGGSTGAVLGGVIGNEAGNTVVGAILGAAVGGAAGAYIGDYMDRQAEELERDLQGATVERVGEGIKITFPAGLLFAVDKATLGPAARTDLGDLSRILKKYDDTDILIEGHTDATGSEDHNLELSRQRAESVASHLVAGAVRRNRMLIRAYGETQPAADNETVEGRQANRRVEVAVMANDRLKEAARSRAE